MSSIKTKENFIVKIMNEGFNRASISFSDFLRKGVRITNQYSLLKQASEFSYSIEGRGRLYVLVTQIIGEFSGKSFLILTEHECSTIFSIIERELKLNDELKEALLLEIDNIISASVISELANELSIEIYGDVPQLFKINASELDNLFREEDKGGDMRGVVFSDTTFKFDGHDIVHPQFVWRLSSKILEMIPVEKINAN